MNDLPCRGEIRPVNWNPDRGGEQAGKRPALIVQNDIGNQYAATTIVAAVSTTVRLDPMNVRLDPPQGGLTKTSLVKAGQRLTVSQLRLQKKLSQVNEKKMSEVDLALRLSLAL